MTSSYRFPTGFVKRALPGLGNVDEFRFVDTLVRDLDPDETHEIPQGASLYVRGWALLPEPPRLGTGVVVTIEPGIRFEPKYGKPRPDIAAHLGAPDVAACGFVGITSLAGLAVGSHDVAVALLDGSDGFHEIGRRTFKLVPSQRLLADKQRTANGRIHISVDEVATLRDPGAFDGRGTIRAASGDVVFVRGWAVDKEARAGLGGVIGVFDDVDCTVGIHGLPRTDAATAINMPTARRCGFTLRIPTRGMKSGKHPLDIAVLSADGSEFAMHRVGTVEIAAP